MSISGPTLTIRVYSLFGLLMYAYDVESYQIPGVASLDHTMYDVVAKAEDGLTPTRDEFRPMVQSLLADRFKLRVHRETRELPVYALVVGEKGPKLKESAADGVSSAHAQLAVVGRNFKTTYLKITMAQLAAAIRNSDGMDRPVLDKTGLTGSYEITLLYCPQYRMSRGTEAELSEISIFTALQELGLKLERQTAPVEMLAIDHVEKPTEN